MSEEMIVEIREKVKSGTYKMIGKKDTLGSTIELFQETENLFALLVTTGFQKHLIFLLSWEIEAIMELFEKVYK